uniref:Glycosyl transferase n=1 Tax=uncultured bacterium CSL132 TaxID=1091568 RepID=G4WVJ3_9BACT|nr:glycosyl transferase [uncultured bacterium CSL132]
MNRKKILFVAEAATLAHTARPLVLSAALDAREFDVSFACDLRCQWLLRDFAGHYFPLASRDGDKFLSALARGKPLYDDATLSCYVRDDLKLFDEARPDVVIGDFRFSLSISARLAGIPYMAISNCYWSPYWRPPRYIVPHLRFLTDVIPIPIADALFNLARPIAFAHHCGPLNRVRRSFGLPSLGNDLRRAYTDADQVLYADVPELFPDAELPAQHQFVGPLLWSPPISVPDWWDAIPSDRPIVYVTLGNSGQAKLFPEILRGLAALDVTVIAATAGADVPDAIPTNAYVAKYLPGEAGARRARLVICNGGSPTSHQALAAGVPVIGIASNLDQFLNMGTIVSAGAGEIIRADRFSSAALAALATKMIAETGHGTAAKQIANVIAHYDGQSRFVATVRDMQKIT